MSTVVQNVANKNKKKKGAAPTAVAGKLNAGAAEASKDSSALPSPRINAIGNENGHGEDVDGAGEREHIREVAKHIRNLNKKLNSMAKVDAIIKENKNLSLDELVATRKINADQKAQALKKPQLQAQLAGLEEQLALYRKLDNEYESRLAKEKEAFESSHALALENARESARAEALAEADKNLTDKLLVLARFLAAAANRRNAGDESGSDAIAFEGALFLVYSGDHNAVSNALKIIDGSEEIVPAVDGTFTGVTFARVKELACKEMPLTRETTYDATYNGQSDPTIANAGLTELDDPTTAQLVNGIDHLNVEEHTAPPPTGIIDGGAANAAADALWDPTKPGAQEDPMVESYEIIPRDPAETETPMRTMTQSWSDEPVGDWATASVAENGAAAPIEQNGKTNENGDGFREVSRQHGGRGGRGWRGGQGSQHRGGFRGGRGGGFRGGERGGERGGRGRGGFRGGRGRGD